MRLQSQLCLIIICSALASFAGCETCLKKVEIAPTVTIKDEAKRNTGDPANSTQEQSSRTDTSDIGFGGKIVLDFDSCLKDSLLIAWKDLRGERKQLIALYGQGRLTPNQFKEQIEKIDRQIANIAAKLGTDQTKTVAAAVLPKPKSAAEPQGAAYLRTLPADQLQQRLAKEIEATLRDVRRSLRGTSNDSQGR